MKNSILLATESINTGGVILLQKSLMLVKDCVISLAYPRVNHCKLIKADIYEVMFLQQGQ